VAAAAAATTVNGIQVVGGERMPKKASRASKTPAKRRWVAKVTTDSTHPPEGLFNKNAATIAKSLASKKVSPKGAASGMRMLTYYINRAGHNLTAERRAELKKAKLLLSKKVTREREAREAANTRKPKKAA
jgi:tRNA(adenine34) deaminase